MYPGRHMLICDCVQVSLDCNDPDEAVFTCEQKSAAQQGGDQQGGGQSASEQSSGYQQEEYAQQAAAQQASPQLPYPWEQLADQNGAVYYYNPQTEEAQWEAPQLTPRQGQGEHREYPQEGG